MSVYKTNKEIIIDLLKKSPKTKMEIADSLKISKDQIKRLLIELVKDGLIYKIQYFKKINGHLCNVYYTKKGD